MAVDPKTFGANIYFLIGLLIFALLVALLILAILTAVKIGIWELRRKKAEETERRRKLEPDGQPYPPTGRGICDGCARGFEKVYHLATGQRLCPDCYRARRPIGGCSSAPSALAGETDANRRPRPGQRCA